MLHPVVSISISYIMLYMFPKNILFHSRLEHFISLMQNEILSANKRKTNNSAANFKNKTMQRGIFVSLQT